MVKTSTTKFSAVFMANGSMVLSKAIKGNFAPEAEITRLSHHVSVLSKKLHVTHSERRLLESKLTEVKLFHNKDKDAIDKRTPLGDMIAKEVKSKDATEELADSRIREDFSDPETKWERMVELFKGDEDILKRETVEKASKKIEAGKKEKGIGSSDNKNVVIGSVIIAGGALQKAKKKKNKKKWKLKSTVQEKDLNKFGFKKR
ncbi:hypothetical protein B9Z19DRAFT_1128218 [Tuber borchii]|uniref:Uncharacterized protein n=1 Tax=Tuber borchii TaxID=42251 RepID=A0A2T6ZPR9_TUBBO|nr:hypothetical protein B9Z19DRAFT_1128218 [Tuber borchii]